MSTVTDSIESATGDSPIAMPSAGSSGEARRRRDEVLVALGRRAIAAPSWRMLAQDAAALVAETLETDQFALAELSDDRSTLTVRIAKTGEDSKDIDSPAHVVRSEPTLSIAGFALSVAQAVSSSDLATETRFQDPMLRQRGIAAAAAIPLLRGNKYFGALLLAHTQPRMFDADELQYFETIAHLVSTTIAHDKVHEELQRQRRFQAAMLDSSVSLMVVLSPAGQIVQTNRAITKVLGFAQDELRDRPIASALLVKEELSVVHQALEQVAKSLNPLMMETWILTKAGERRRFQWSLAALTNEAEDLEQIILTGVDITRQREIETELEQLRGAGGDSSTARPFSPIPEGKNSERRQRTRRQFPYVQMIAPLVAGHAPEEHHFRPVRCRDISPTGFSFLSPVPPDFQDLMVALGGESTTTYLAARVMHATIVERDNKAAYIVGCRYLSRAKKDEEAK
jgi:PAS domain S-box-containing protein